MIGHAEAVFRNPSRTRRLRNQQWRADAMSQIKRTNKFTAFAVGVGAGALLAMLFARASGEETREYLTSALKQCLDGAASTGRRGTRRAQVTVDDVKVKVAGAVEAGGKAYRTARDA